MTFGTSIDIPRLIRIASVLFAFAAAVGVDLTYRPQIDAAERLVEDRNDELRSDQVAFREATFLRGERARLAGRYAMLFAENPQAVFVRELATTMRRNGVTLVSTSVTPEDPNGERSAAGLLTKTHVTIVMSGSYRRLLGTVADLSAGSEIVDVGVPNLTREGTSVVASVPVDIYEPRKTTFSQARGDTR